MILPSLNWELKTRFAWIVFRHADKPLALRARRYPFALRVGLASRGLLLAMINSTVRSLGASTAQLVKYTLPETKIQQLPVST